MIRDDEQTEAPSGPGGGAPDLLLQTGDSSGAEWGNILAALHNKKDAVIGSTVNGYQITARLGQGGMGIVYQGEHAVIGKRAAIKVLRPEIAQNQEQVQRLVSEARAVNAVGHRGIVDVFGYEKLPDGRQCIVMELLDGEPLGELLDRNRREHRAMMMPEVMIILEEVLSALSAAHSAGVIHRDLKPSNIFLCKQRDGSRYVKLLDFGIAKLGVLDGAAQQSNASMMVGTPAYMAPEQARGGAVGPAMDLYAVGVIAFEMLTGVLPFSGESVVDVLMKHAEAPPPRPSSLLMSIPDDVDDLVMRLLAKKPEDRFHTAEQTRVEVVKLRKSLSDSTARRTQPFMPLGPPRAAAADEVSDVTLKPFKPPPDLNLHSTQPVSGELPATQPSVAAPAEPPKKGVNVGLILGVIGLLLGATALAIVLMRG